MPQFMVAITVLAILVLGAIGVAGLYGLTRALTRWTTETGRQNISVRLAAASVTAMLVFFLMYLSAWVALRTTVVIGGSSDLFRITMTENDFLEIRAALSDHCRNHGHYPDSLDELRDFKYRHWHDLWGHPYHYERTESGYRLLSLGRDGKPGGIGLDADIEPAAGQRIEITPTVSQFLFEARGSGLLFGVALIASLCAGLACFLSSAPRLGRPVGLRNLLWPILRTTVVAIGIGLFLVLFYSVGDH